jgi:hypothetical protein
MKFEESDLFSPADYAIDIMMHRYERPDMFNEAYIQGLYNGIALLGGVDFANMVWKEILGHQFTGSPVTFL